MKVSKHFTKVSIEKLDLASTLSGCYDAEKEMSQKKNKLLMSTVHFKNYGCCGIDGHLFVRKIFMNKGGTEEEIAFFINLHLYHSTGTTL